MDWTCSKQVLQQGWQEHYTLAPTHTTRARSLVLPHAIHVFWVHCLAHLRRTPSVHQGAPTHSRPAGGLSRPVRVCHLVRPPFTPAGTPAPGIEATAATDRGPQQAQSHPPTRKHRRPAAGRSGVAAAALQRERLPPEVRLSWVAEPSGCGSSGLCVVRCRPSHRAVVR